MRMRTVVTAASALGLLGVLTACAGGTLDAHVQANPQGTAANHQPGVATAPATTASSVPVTPSASVSASVAAGKPVADSFSAELDLQRPGVAMIMLTNTSKHTVTVQGWSSLSFSNAHGDVLSVPTERVQVPGPGPAIRVVPGGSVFAPVEWAQGDKGDAATLVADGVRVVPPGWAKSVRTKVVGVDGSAPGYYEFDMKSIKIGTFQASTHNLLSF